MTKTKSHIKKIEDLFDKYKKDNNNDNSSGTGGNGGPSSKLPQGTVRIDDGGTCYNKFGVPIARYDLKTGKYISIPILPRMPTFLPVNPSIPSIANIPIPGPVPVPPPAPVPPLIPCPVP